MILSPFTSPALSTLKQTHRHTLQILAKGSITAFLESDGLLCGILIILGSSNDASFFCLTFFSFLSYFLKKEFNCSWLYAKEFTLKLARSCVAEKQEKGRVLLSVLRAPDWRCALTDIAWQGYGRSRLTVWVCWAFAQDTCSVPSDQVKLKMILYCIRQY